MTIYDTSKDGEITILFDSRWQNPEVLGYKPEDPQYKLLRRLWEEAMGEKVTGDATADTKAELIQPAD